VSYGAIPITLNCLRIHPSHKGVHIQGLMALAIMARHSTAACIVLSSTACSPLVCCVRRGHSACRAWRAEPDARAIRAQGGEAIARAALAAFPESADVKESASVLLRTVERLDAQTVADMRPYYER
jgi:hypothetical protein